MQKIFVGDVSGCGDELEELLARAGRSFGTGYELWCVGDLINRGPKNLLALRRMRELVAAGRGTYVLGNHEINLLRIWLGLREFGPRDTCQEVLEADASEGWMDWIRSRRLAARGELGGSRFVMVHASVHPDWTAEEVEARARRVERRLASSDLAQLRALLCDDEPTGDPSLAEDRDTLGRLTRCRSVDARLNWSSAQPQTPAKPWHVAWSQRRHRYGVVYGHWSLQGLHVAPGLRGLDTGCVHNGRDRDGYLTGWLPAATDTVQTAVDQFDLPDDRFWRLPARRRYYASR